MCSFLIYKFTNLEKIELCKNVLWKKWKTKKIKSDQEKYTKRKRTTGTFLSTENYVHILYVIMYEDERRKLLSAVEKKIVKGKYG